LAGNFIDYDVLRILAARSSRDLRCRWDSYCDR
jgi:hypothetical protein